METELISVIMSTYKENPSDLCSAIESILNQTYKNIEYIIVLDNPLNEEINKILNDYRKKDDRIKIINNSENIGLAFSLNKAIKISRGEYVARMDADDISELKRLEKQIEYMKVNNLDILGGGTEVIDEQGKITQKFEGIISGNKIVNKSLLINNIVAHPTWMVKKRVYQELKGYRNIHTAEDYDFLLRARKKRYKIDNLNSCVLKYRLTQDSISRSNEFKQILTSYYLKKNYNNTKKMINIEKWLEIKMDKDNIIKYTTGKENIVKMLSFIKGGDYKNTLIALINIFRYGHLENIKFIFNIIIFKILNKFSKGTM